MSILTPLALDSSKRRAALDDLVHAWLPEIHGNRPEALQRLAAGPRMRFGALVRTLHEDNAGIVENASRRSLPGERIGESLVRLGMMAPAERDAILAYQRHLNGDAPTDSRLRLGHILVSTGKATPGQLRTALHAQRRSGRRLGEELVASGHVEVQAIDEALGIQRKLVAASLAASVALAHPGIIAPAVAAQQASQSVRFVIKVPPMVRLQVRRQPATLDLAAADIARGWIEVPAAALLEVQTNTPWEVNFHAAPAVVRNATVKGLLEDVSVGPEGGSVANLVAVRQPVSYELSYRLELAPGSYPWPVSVSAHAI